MKVPGQIEANWRCRCTKDLLYDYAFEGAQDLTKSSKRLRVIGTLNTGTILEVTSPHESDTSAAQSRPEHLAR